MLHQIQQGLQAGNKYWTSFRKNRENGRAQLTTFVRESSIGELTPKAP